MANESYYLRAWRRFRKDATPWARDNILWGIVVLVVPPLAVWWRNPHAAIDVELIKTTLVMYGISFVIYAAVHALRVPRKLDDEREGEERTLRATISTLTAKPQRTPAEQHDYDTAKKALQLLGEDGKIALRHLRKHGSLKFGFPIQSGLSAPGLTVDRTLWVYNHCASEGLLTMNEKYGSGEKTYAISPKMEKVLEELLFEDGASSAG